MDIKVPAFPESVEDGTITSWHKQEGDSFERDEVLVEIETDKVVLEVPSPKSGTLIKITAKEGETVTAQQVIGSFKEGAGGGDKEATTSKPVKEEAPEAEAPKAGDSKPSTSSDADKSVKAGPAARRMAMEKGVDLNEVAGQTGSRVTKQDVANFSGSNNKVATERTEKRVPMSRLRASVAKRLVESQQNAAMLTTFNEVNMKPVMDLRAKYKDAFVEKHNGIKLGFMSFFVKGSVLALMKYPEVNSYVEGNEIVYHNYMDVGIAVSSARGLVVPVLRDAQLLGLAGIESEIATYAAKANDGKLALEELQGGTFTISNGGVFGSLLSTPIINPPQTAILGMHKIQERPVVVSGKLEILPMMYLALSYDHRMIDGKTAVQFLVAIRNFLENPGLVLLDL